MGRRGQVAWLVGAFAMVGADAHAGRRSWVVDPTSLSSRVGAWPVHQTVSCPPVSPDAPTLRGQRLHTLGVAAVVYSRKQFTMGWGHASLRALLCLDGELVDVEYEAYRLGPGNMHEVERVLAGESVLGDADYLRRERGALFRFRNDHPVDGGFYAASHDRNREIYELWLDPARHDLDAMVLRLEAALDDQLERLRSRAPLDGRYRVFSTNCTVPLQETLGHAEWAMPFRWLRELRDEAVLRVLHPSVHVAGRWSDYPDAVRRPSPVFRSQRSVPPVGDRTPRVPLESVEP